MKQIDLHIPVDVLRSLLDGKQTNVPYTLNGHAVSPDTPLRIVIWVKKAEPKVKRFGGRA